MGGEEFELQLDEATDSKEAWDHSTQSFAAKENFCKITLLVILEELSQSSLFRSSLS